MTPNTKTAAREYTDEEILKARGMANFTTKGYAVSLDDLRAFLAALPSRQQAQTGPWPSQQEAIDAAFVACEDAHLSTIKSTDLFKKQELDRLAIAQSYSAARPQSAEIASLKAEVEQTRLEYSEMKRRLQAAEHINEGYRAMEQKLEEAQAELAALRQPIQAADDRSLEYIAIHAHEKAPAGMKWLAAAKAVVAAVRPAIEAEAIATAVRRMEAVPVFEMWNIWGRTKSLTELRARLIAAAMGDVVPVDAAQELVPFHSSNVPQESHDYIVDSVDLSSGAKVAVGVADDDSETVMLCFALPTLDGKTNVLEFGISGEAAVALLNLLTLKLASEKPAETPNSADEKAKQAKTDLAVMARRLQAAEHVNEGYRALEQKLAETQAELAALKSSTIGILRPLAEAGPVPAGCTRVTAFQRSGSNQWLISNTLSTRDTHFIDVKLPGAASPVATDQAAASLVATDQAARIQELENYLRQIRHLTQSVSS